VSRIINLTPHSLVILQEDELGDHEVVIGRGAAARRGVVSIALTIPPRVDGAGRPLPAAAKEFNTPVAPLILNGILVPLIERRFGPPIDLPEPKEGVLLFVGGITLAAAVASGRPTADLVTPGEAVTKDGKPFGVLSLARHG